jgi:hypothetical protein
MVPMFRCGFRFAANIAAEPLKFRSTDFDADALTTDADTGYKILRTQLNICFHTLLECAMRRAAKKFC